MVFKLSQMPLLNGSDIARTNISSCTMHKVTWGYDEQFQSVFFFYVRTCICRMSSIAYEVMKAQ